MTIFSRKQVNISHKKMTHAIKSIKRFSLTQILNLTYTHSYKAYSIIKKLLQTAIKNNTTHFTHYELFCNKSKHYKKPIARAKGKTDFFKKRYCNLYIALR
ncbi:hypothetical protein JSR02_00720 [Candidatus Vidania fulgoroideae]|uniref:50S ribosomal protein L22 n=1 Tax=Candidatus Vidania fulgoroideorum TaxID=881286 RepID=A0A974X9D9_9PROT|nr:hypothetical protein JSR02_00720 [Candidatus Vidania fulgoroideae]